MEVEASKDKLCLKAKSYNKSMEKCAERVLRSKRKKKRKTTKNIYL